MHRAIQRRYGRRRRSFRGRRRSLFSRHHLHHRFHTLSPNKRHLSFDSPQTRIRRSRLIHSPMDRRSVCFSRSFSTTSAGYSKFPFFPLFLLFSFETLRFSLLRLPFLLLRLLRLPRFLLPPSRALSSKRCFAARCSPRSTTWKRCETSP